MKEETYNLSNAVLAIDVNFLFDNWENEEDFFKEFEEFETVEQKRNYFIKTYGKQYKEKYGEYPKIVLKSIL